MSSTKEALEAAQEYIVLARTSVATGETIVQKLIAALERSDAATAKLEAENATLRTALVTKDDAIKQMTGEVERLAAENTRLLERDNAKAPVAGPERTRYIFDKDGAVDEVWAPTAVQLTELIGINQPSIRYMFQLLSRFELLVNCVCILNMRTDDIMTDSQYRRIAYAILLEQKVGVAQLTWAMLECGRTDLVHYVRYRNGDTVDQRKTANSRVSQAAKVAVVDAPVCKTPSPSSA